MLFFKSKNEIKEEIVKVVSKKILLKNAGCVDCFFSFQKLKIGIKKNLWLSQNLSVPFLSKEAIRREAYLKRFCKSKSKYLKWFLKWNTSESNAEFET